jgi:hypothetical protein
VKKKPDVIERRDGRIELRGAAYTRMKNKLRDMAGNKCEECGRFDTQGDAHHYHGRGGGKRDDRIFVAGKRNLFYLCRKCHGGRHVPDKVIPAKLNDDEFETLLGIGGSDVHRHVQGGGQSD